MIRKLNEMHIDKVLDASNKGQLTSVHIYKAETGKNKGSDMIDYEIDKDSLSNTPVHRESHAQLVKALREIKQYVSNRNYESINLKYDLVSKEVIFRVVVKK